MILLGGKLKDVRNIAGIIEIFSRQRNRTHKPGYKMSCEGSTEVGSNSS